MNAQLHLFDALAWRLAQGLPGLRSGSHAGRMRGAGENFADIAPLLAHPDPRRLDLRRSVMDPLGTLHVRRFQTRTDLRLHVALDASASLGAVARADRLGLARLLAAGFAQAARCARDLFSLTVCAGDRVLHDQPPTRRSLAPELLELPLEPAGRGTDALTVMAHELPRERVLVVLISDFELAQDELAALLTILRPRAVLPIWLRDSGLDAPPPQLGLAEVRDPETGRRRTVLTTPRWATRQAQATANRHTALRRTFAEHGLSPIEITDSIDVAQLAVSVSEAPL
ncbi:hypothetical protein [Paracoccus sp. (in: a-proteobacteria)]|uniref:DUF58 domain-containing protein n=1 Tax=Paracoccus sp. TaxID=267 RepID=UPI002AFEA111|nr:hypothetical protein [Paracoccus sp. (in: a-proteobacteria)]